MNNTLTQILQDLQATKQPEKIFGALPSDGDKKAQRALDKRYRTLAKAIHPDHNPNAIAAAEEAFVLLGHWYAVACDKLKRGVYGKTARLVVTTAKGHYESYDDPISGDLCDLYPSQLGKRPILLKLARKGSDNELLDAERRSLKRLHRRTDGDALRAHFPLLHDAFQLIYDNGSNRRVNVLRQETGYASVEAVVAAYPSGINAADMAWMFNRLLAALGVAHSLGIVHGAVLPPHVLIRPRDHNGLLLDWCYSVKDGNPLQATDPAYRAFYPPEALAGEPVSAATDIYMAAMCMLHLLGGDLKTHQLPPSVPKPIRNMLAACLLPSPHRRYSDAWELFELFRGILRRVYGQPTFRPFQI